MSIFAHQCTLDECFRNVVLIRERKGDKYTDEDNSEKWRETKKDGWMFTCALDEHCGIVGKKAVNTDCEREKGKYT